ncbi:TetR/AcrR family transcriptional regulator [Nocardia bovistercoris]|uniref:TetR/AcrR family transcriptional regulator n=1 Tax=Nocardia bovistercoris TaxID=2785916 RepID=A0A931N120_9NOCA|nr:TetR/AcrR family transcriptional regulator [Nocardia bovistercoris]MBH0775237.1 TetR/AcrR family transcriptional regulator [Nocardia bovistercoris]
MVEKVSRGTRERLLAAAERLLLTEPYDDVSVRAVCTAAGANPAAVHYHFGSKEALVGALIEDRLGPLWADDMAHAATRRPTSATELVDTVLAPFRTLAADPLGRLHLRLLARFVLGRHLTAWQGRWFRMDSWTGLLPHLSAGESRRRWMLAFDLIIMRFGSPEVEEYGISERAVATLRDFVVAGLTAPTQE